mgnify:CR=1 FL=1
MTDIEYVKQKAALKELTAIQSRLSDMPFVNHIEYYALLVNLETLIKDLGNAVDKLAAHAIEDEDNAAASS